jgi:hypothetical protein
MWLLDISSWQADPRTPATRRHGSPVPAAPLYCHPEVHDCLAGPRTPATCRLGSSMPEAAAMASGSPCPHISRPQGVCCILGTRQFKPASFAAPWVSSAWYSVPGAYCHTHSEPLAPCFAILLVPESSLPTEHRGSVINTKFSHGRAPTALSKSENPALPLTGYLSFCGCQETCFPKAQKHPVLPTVPDHRRAPTSPLKTKNATFPIEGRKAVNS